MRSSLGSRPLAPARASGGCSSPVAGGSRACPPVTVSACLVLSPKNVCSVPHCWSAWLRGLLAGRAPSLPLRPPSSVHASMGRVSAASPAALVVLAWFLCPSVLPTALLLVWTIALVVSACFRIISPSASSSRLFPPVSDRWSSSLSWSLPVAWSHSCLGVPTALLLVWKRFFSAVALSCVRASPLGRFLSSRSIRVPCSRAFVPSSRTQVSDVAEDAMWSYTPAHLLIMRIPSDPYR